jgi:hypothetical protein
MVVIGKMCLMGVITMTHTKDLNRSINNIVDVLFIGVTECIDMQQIADKTKRERGHYQYSYIING